MPERNRVLLGLGAGWPRLRPSEGPRAPDAGALFGGATQTCLTRAAFTGSQVLVGNKSDMPEGKRAVTFAQGKALAEEFGISFFETSAKTGDAVEDVFASIARDVKGRLDTEAQGGKGALDTTTIRPSKQKAKGKGGCC